MFSNYKLFVIIFFLLTNLHSLMADKSANMEEIYLIDNHNSFNPYVEFYTTDIKDFFHPEKFSKYPSTNLFDGNLKTCWIVGSVKKKEKNILYIKVPKNIPNDKLILNIFSGYGKSKKLYYDNARPKHIQLSILSGHNIQGHNTEVANQYIIDKNYTTKELQLSDTFGVQSFPLKINKKSGLLILKIEITDVYKGKKYNDICISEIFFNNRIVTQHSNSYHKIKSVDIEGEYSLYIDYRDGQRVTIYKDKSSVFTMLDWDKDSNWAILHYVKKSETAINSRVEESILLIDLENKKVINDKLKKYTGNSIYSALLEKGKYENTLLDIFETYKIELK